MTAPTQQFPPWLTPSPSVITDAGGIPISTSTTIVYLPLTYFGPSIPLGSLFTFGGSTSPASTAPATSETTVASTSLTTSPPTTSITSLPSSTATPSSSISSLPSSVSLSTSFNPSLSSSISSAIPSSVQSTFSTSSVPSSSSSASPTASGGLRRGQLIGVIVGSILVLIFLFVFALALYLWCKGRPNRQSRTRFSMVTPIDEDYFIVAPGGRSPGEGSPRHSGEEADPFLQRSSSAAGSAQMREVGVRSAAGQARPPGADEVSFSTADSASNASGYGNVIERPSLGLLPSMMEESELRGSILSPEELRRLDRESVLPPDDFPEGDGEGAHAYTALLPPPRLIDPETASHRSLPRPPKTSGSYTSQQSLDNEEAGTLLTARRVKMEDLVPRPSPHSPLNKELSTGPSTSRVSGGILGSLGLGGLAGLNRMSWFRGTDSPRNSQHSATYAATPLTDDDLESGRAAYLTPPPTRRSRRAGVGLDVDGDRPISSVSARSNASGGTVYHDAHSSIPGTPILSSALAPPPRAVTPPDVPSHQETTHWPSTTTMHGPPAYERFEGLASPHSRGPSTTNLSQIASPPPKFDVLDLPAPTAITSFTSSSSLHGATSNSTIIKSLPFPPGLELLTSPKAWTEMSTGATPSPGSFAAVSGNDNTAGISIDVLEEAPPSAGDGWRSLATTGFPEVGRRTTFGLPQLVHPPELVSEQGSLHSMRSHLSPTSSRSTGSAPASRRDLSGSLGSDHSQTRSGSSGFSRVQHSLGRSGSISSEERRRSGPISPALSAFGPISRAADGNLSPVVGSPVSAHLSPHRASRSTEPSSPLSGELHLSAPWAGGLDQDWAAR